MPGFSSMGPFTTFMLDTEETIKLAYVSGPTVVVGTPTTVADPGALTSTQNATAAAATQTGSYVQVDVQTIATLANALKTSYNAAQVDIAALRTAFLALTAALRTAGAIA